MLSCALAAVEDHLALSSLLSDLECAAASGDAFALFSLPLVIDVTAALRGAKSSSASLTTAVQPLWQRVGLQWEHHPRGTEHWYIIF